MRDDRLRLQDILDWNEVWQVAASDLAVLEPAISAILSALPDRADN